MAEQVMLQREGPTLRVLLIAVAMLLAAPRGKRPRQASRWPLDTVRPTRAPSFLGGIYGHRIPHRAQSCALIFDDNSAAEVPSSKRPLLLRWRGFRRAPHSNFSHRMQHTGNNALQLHQLLLRAQFLRQ